MGEIEFRKIWGERNHRNGNPSWIQKKTY